MYSNVTWEMEHGIVEHPEWYEGSGLRPDSPFEDFQAYKHETNPDIPLPCGVCPLGQVHAKDGACTPRPQGVSSGASGAAALDAGACHTLTKPDGAAWFNVTWEMEHGIVEHPEWYEGSGLRPDSPFEDFQAYEREKYPNISRPCGACPAGQVHNKDGVCMAKDAAVFYMFRADSDAEYTPINVNMANLDGVMWYLQHEVLQPVCPDPVQRRKFNITRIRRIKVTLKNPPDLELNRTFSQFFAYDSGRCSTPECEEFFNLHGYAVGCQKIENRVDGLMYTDAVWYSIPGPCPLFDYNVKPPGCEVQEPGGMCDAPTGARDCTYKIEEAGNVSIDELEGVGDIDTFCAKGGGEYDKGIDGGYHLDFWNGGKDAARNKARVKAATELFKSRFPDMPADLPAPACDWG